MPIIGATCGFGFASSQRENADCGPVIGQVVKWDVALNMAGDDFELIGRVMQKNMINQDAMRTVRPKLAALYSPASAAGNAVAAFPSPVNPAGR